MTNLLLRYRFPPFPFSSVLTPSSFCTEKGVWYAPRCQKNRGGEAMKVLQQQHEKKSIM